MHQTISGWYLAQVKPNSYKLAELNLKRQGFNTFLPKYLTTKIKSQRFKTSNTPLFPGYIFVKLSKISLQLRSLKATRGISGIVSLDGKYKPLPEYVVKELKAHCDKNDIFSLTHNFKQKDRVQIKMGPFSNFIAQIEALEPNQRALVLIDTVGRRLRTNISTNNLVLK